MLPICVFFNMETFYCSTAASILLLSLGQAPTCATTFAMYQASVPMGQGGRPIPVSPTARRRRGARAAGQQTTVSRLSTWHVIMPLTPRSPAVSWINVHTIRPPSPTRLVPRPP
ncbi:hypothetical protein IWZ01DRAFT_155535 [Phyllosticta capitalensis]